MLCLTESLLLQAPPFLQEAKAKPSGGDNSSSGGNVTEAPTEAPAGDAKYEGDGVKSRRLQDALRLSCFFRK